MKSKDESAFQENKVNIKRPGTVIAATGSSNGKTLITCGLLQAMLNRGLKPVSFKCGPDYIDPMFHKKVLGVDSDNLDIFFAKEEGIRETVAKSSGDYTIIEGVMGLYDGMDVKSKKASAYDVATVTNLPVILLVDASGAGRTLISVIKGMLIDDDNKLIKGIILNKISTGFYNRFKPVIEEELERSGFGHVKCLGGIPKVQDISMDSRHLGLKLPWEIPGIKDQIEKMGSVIENNCDVDGLLKIMEDVPGISVNRQVDIFGENESRIHPVIAVAMDEAFCFYYGENFKLLEKFGARLKYFSPIHDEKIPDGAAGLILGGGYPELFLNELGSNLTMLSSVKNAIERGMPSLAECGGFMYLHKAILDKEQNSYPMVGVIDGECFYTPKPVRFGYMEIKGINPITKNKCFCDITGIKGHEFHYYDSTCNGECFVAGKPLQSNEWTCMIGDENKLWGFPHFYYGSLKDIAKTFVDRCADFGGR
ncbi:MAG: cobyrinate a,c-diamide synthase [Lachnospiraceae bacterium]|nr:cobyrinate a,c-diamide synthase [Lachnospiraceae bacterium]